MDNIITLTPIPVGESLPDADTNVLLFLADGTSCEGFLDGVWEEVEGQPPLFRDVCADALDRDAVTSWCPMPEGPRAC